MRPERGVLTIVGCGPGGREYLTGQAEMAVAQAELLCGPEFLLSLFPEAPGERLVVGADAGQVIALLRPRLEYCRAVLLVTGDPGLHSLAVPVTRLLGADRVRLIPGISAVQLGFARLARPWGAARIFSLHNAGEEGAAAILDQAAAAPVAVVLCSPAWTPGRILETLVATAGHRTAHVLSDLGRPAEYRISGSVADLASRAAGGGRSLVILTEEEP